MNDDLRAMARTMAQAAMAEGSKIAMDSSIRMLGKLVEEFTVKGAVREAAGASAAMEMLKRLRDHDSEQS